MNSSRISSANTIFWDELCGTKLTKSICIKDSSSKSLKKSDYWYFDFYPYLFGHIPFDDLKNKNVLEVGLGYGTVSQRLAESGANYQGLDIAAGPVNMVNHQLRQEGLGCRAIQGSMLDPPFELGSFNTIIPIGCLHHTLGLKKQLINVITFFARMGTNIYDLLCLFLSTLDQIPFATLNYLFKELNGFREVIGLSGRRDRAAYDKNSNGGGAPYTDWISKKSSANHCSKFQPVIENIDREPPFIFLKRKTLLKTKIPLWVGLDLYFLAKK